MGRDWVVFDGDDTLWETTALYEAARESFVAMVAGRAPGVDPAEVEARQRSHDLELAAAMGYSRARFPLGLADTALHFLGEGPHVEEASRIGRSVFAARARPRAGSAEAVAALAAGWNLGLVTAGDRHVQARRVSHFPHRDAFDAVRIVKAKDSRVFARFAARCGIVPGRSWVVGDSLRSDIIPAAEAGFRTVHLSVHNWHAHENHGRGVPDGCVVAGSLAEAFAAISGHALPGPPVP